MAEVDPKKHDAALNAGAIAVVDPRQPDALSEIARIAGKQVRAAIDFVGSEQTAALAFESLAKGGTLVTVGFFGGVAPWSLPLIPMRCVTIQGNYVGSLDEMKELLELVKRTGMPQLPLTNSPLQEANTMLDRMETGNVIGRVVLHP